MGSLSVPALAQYFEPIAAHFGSLFPQYWKVLGRALFALLLSRLEGSVLAQLMVAAIAGMLDCLAALVLCFLEFRALYFKLQHATHQRDIILFYAGTAGRSVHQRRER